MRGLNHPSMSIWLDKIGPGLTITRTLFKLGHSSILRNQYEHLPGFMSDSFLGRHGRAIYKVIMDDGKSKFFKAKELYAYILYLNAVRE
jgi:hypothetical protein